MIAVLIGLVGGGARHQFAALLFLAFQLSLAYATASLVKFSEGVGEVVGHWPS